jgi:hypothetical protein
VSVASGSGPVTAGFAIFDSKRKAYIITTIPNKITKEQVSRINIL